MSFLDSIIGIFLIYNGFIGLKRGFVRILLDFLSLVISTLGAIYYAPMITPVMSHYLPFIAKHGQLICFGSLWLTLFLIISGISLFFNTILDRTLVLGPINRLLGLALGLVKGAIFSALLLLPLYTLHLPSYESSTLPKLFTPLLLKISPKIPFK